MKSYLSVGLSVVSITTSIVALCLVAPNVHPSDFDYLGFIVGVLSLLVTLILGWQIYNVISTTERIKKLKSLYDNISVISQSCEREIELSKYYVRGLVTYVETVFNYELDKIKGKESNVSLCNSYLRIMETFADFLSAHDSKYPALCLLSADHILSELSSLLTDTDETLPPQFDSKCDNLYYQIASGLQILSVGDIDFFHSVRARRKSLSTDSHNPPAANHFGIQISENRVSK